ncbi:hypothetical protein N7474_007318 [Penicillium riverlandense]|uniref:uncharacterized protein n=1 Tax=Penicillium riverlandense TaxID=1903569 RepID=UPI002548999D|nr:uncharacterized protein N7474_007318 [Penicillium riverlandense]KAJ5815541.1 hypothetical protein N7474_007318 [Penicillium riverlandense]
MAARMVRIGRLISRRWTKTIVLVSIVLSLFVSSGYFAKHQRLDPGQLQLGDEHLILETRDQYNGQRLTWKDAEAQGKQLYCAMTAAPQDTAGCFKTGTKIQSTSEFTQYGDLAKWGWVEKKSSSEVDDCGFGGFNDFGDPEALDITKNLEPVFQYLEVNLAAVDVYTEKIEWVQSNTVTIEGVTYGATNGLYANLFNVQSGFIIADVIESPAFRSSTSSHPVEHLVKLEKWSDVTFLQWKKSCVEKKKPVTDLKYVIQNSITNVDTVAILREALGKPNDFDGWGDYRDKSKFKTFDATSNAAAFDALLRTPNVRGTAYMLIQHKDAFGGSWKVSSITLFGQVNGNWKPGLIIEVEPVH